MTNVAQIKVPDVGNVPEIDVVEVLIKPGDSIELEQTVATLETDKASMDLPARAAGVVQEVFIKKGDKVAEGTLIATIAIQEAAAKPAEPAPPRWRPRVGIATKVLLGFGALAGEFASFAVGPWELFWVLFYGFATCLFAGHMREQVCKYMCPYARFQSAMFDKDTLIISYDAERGEPRGPRGRSRRPRDRRAASERATRPRRAPRAARTHASPRAPAARLPRCGSAARWPFSPARRR